MVGAAAPRAGLHVRDDERRPAGRGDAGRRRWPSAPSAAPPPSPPSARRAAAPSSAIPTSGAALWTMRALALGGRLLALYAADQRGRDAARADLLIPVAKAWASDAGVEAASLGVQVHGGMGYIEETGAAQHLRDARIAPIYEGTNGIQALTLLRRGLLRDQGAALGALLDEQQASASRRNRSAGRCAGARGGGVAAPGRAAATPRRAPRHSSASRHRHRGLARPPARSLRPPVGAHSVRCCGIGNSSCLIGR